MASPAMMTIPEVEVSSIHLRRKPVAGKNEISGKDERIVGIVERSLAAKGSNDNSIASKSSKESSSSSFGVEQARQEAMQHAMFGQQQQHLEMVSVGTTSESSNSKQTTTGADDVSGSEEVFPPTSGFRNGFLRSKIIVH